MLLAWTEWTYVSGRIVNESMPYLFVLALESFATGAAQASFNWAKMRSILRMHIRMRTVTD